MDWEESPPSFRISLLSRLACFADMALQSQIREGVSVNGIVDFEDLLLQWDYGPADKDREVSSLSPDEMELLQEFDHHLNKVYLSHSSSWGKEGWGWLYSNKEPLPKSWALTVELANSVLKRFPDFKLHEWREQGYPIWN